MYIHCIIFKAIEGNYINFSKPLRLLQAMPWRLLVKIIILYKCVGEWWCGCVCVCLLFFFLFLQCTVVPIIIILCSCSYVGSKVPKHVVAVVPDAVEAQNVSVHLQKLA